MSLQSRLAGIAGLLWIATGASAFAQPQMTPQPPATEPAAQSAQQAPADPLAAAPRISGEEARQALAKGEAVLVDVRAKEAYDAGHAKGAISLPLSDLSTRMGELPKDKLVITYCT
jgi:3-mercaptopyruvate sulfurtransferase SseA